MTDFSLQVLGPGLKCAYHSSEVIVNLHRLHTPAENDVKVDGASLKLSLMYETPEALNVAQSRNELDFLAGYFTALLSRVVNNRALAMKQLTVVALVLTRTSALYACLFNALVAALLYFGVPLVDVAIAAPLTIGCVAHTGFVFLSKGLCLSACLPSCGRNDAPQTKSDADALELFFSRIRGVRHCFDDFFFQLHKSRHAELNSVLHTEDASLCTAPQRSV